MDSAATIDIRSDAFAKRLANLLTDRRNVSGATIRELVRASDRAFTSRYLRAAEEGRAGLDEQTVCQLAALYGAELADILPARAALRIEVASTSGTGTAVGIVSTSGVSTEFDARNRDSLLTSYLLLVRQLRSQERAPLIVLRREDVETIAEYLEEDGPSIVERLSTLMGATRLQRRAMVGLFIAGAIVIGLAGSGVAALTVGGGGAPSERPPPATATVFIPAVGTLVTTVTTAASDDAASPDELVATTSEPAMADTPSPGAPLGDLPGADTLDTIPVSVAPATVPVVVPATVIVTGPVIVTVPAVDTVPAPAVDIVPVATTPRAGTSSPSQPGPATRPRPPAVATSEPVEPTAPSEPSVGVADPPLVPDASPPPTSPELQIPDLPYDPPTTTEVPSVATTEPPVPDSTPPTTPTTSPEVATGEPPVPPSL